MKKRWSVGHWASHVEWYGPGRMRVQITPRVFWYEKSRHWSRRSAELRVQGWHNSGKDHIEIRDLKEEK